MDILTGCSSSPTYTEVSVGLKLTIIYLQRAQTNHRALQVHEQFNASIGLLRERQEATHFDFG
jgi:hypothetical protein